MNPFTFAAMAGILCLPSTYSLSREGSIFLSVSVVALIGVIGGAIAQRGKTDGFHPGSLALAFIVGAMFSEVVAFGHYYITYGYKDPKLSVGVGVSVIEFLVISILGGFALLSAAYLTHSRITRP